MPAAQDGRTDLLAAIRGASKGGLKKVNTDEDGQSNRHSDTLSKDTGLAGALAAALAKRKDTIQGQDMDDSDVDDDDDDEWDD